MNTIVEQVYVLDGGTETIDHSALVSGTNYGQLIDVPVMQWLIRTARGCILVDTGNDPRVAEDPSIWDRSLVEAVRPKMEPRNHPYAQLELIGLSPQDVKLVVYTHLHHDHAGGARLFPHARHIVQKEEHRWAYSPDRFAKRIYLDTDLNYDLNWFLADGDLTLAPGIQLLTTPGHTPGHQSIVLWDVPDVGTVILAGDAIYTTETVRSDLPPSIVTDTREAMNSIHRLTALAEARDAMLFVGHDMQFFQQIHRAPDPLRRVGDQVLRFWQEGKALIYPEGVPTLD